MTNLDELKELTQQLKFHQVTKNDTVVLDPITHRALSVMHGLKWIPAISCADITIFHGEPVPPHSHKELIVFVLYEGHCEITIEQHTQEYSAPAAIIIPPNNVHNLIFGDDEVKMISLSLPANTGWPRG